VDLQTIRGLTTSLIVAAGAPAAFLTPVSRQFLDAGEMLLHLLAFLCSAFSCSLPGLAAEAVDVAVGERLYADYCSSCHGEELRNTSGSVTFDLRRLRPGDHDHYLNAVLNGKIQMPPWRGALEPDQIEAIWVYIRSVNDK
jgi:mono/diheme cytochrome c family protein